MSKPRKTRRDAKLKNLPLETARKIAAWLQEDGAQSCLQRMRSELGITASQTALYEALPVWEVRESYDGFERLAKAQADVEAASLGGMTADQMQEAVDRNFIALAAQAKDVKLYTELRYMRIADQSAKSQGRIAEEKLRQAEKKLAQKDRDFELARAKFELEAAEKMLSAALRAKADEINASGLSNADKIAAMRKAAFAEIDELQASGRVVIPK